MITGVGMPIVSLCQSIGAAGVANSTAVAAGTVTTAGAYIVSKKYREKTRTAQEKQCENPQGKDKQG